LQNKEKEQIGRITLHPADVRTIQKIWFCVRHAMCSVVSDVFYYTKLYVLRDPHLGSFVIKEKSRNDKDWRPGPERWMDAIHCNTLQHTATHCNIMQHNATHCNTLQHSATRCNALQHTATHCNTLQHTATHCNTLQHTATHCNTLQHTATHCIERRSPSSAAAESANVCRASDSANMYRVSESVNIDRASERRFRKFR